MKRLILALLTLMLLAPAAFAQTAAEITARCTLSGAGKKTLERMTDGD